MSCENSPDKQEISRQVLESLQPYLDSYKKALIEITENRFGSASEACAAIRSLSLSIEAINANSKEAVSCQWKMDEDGMYYTDCDHAYTVNEGTATENEMKFCCFCGRQIIDIPYVDDPEEFLSDEEIEGSVP